MAVVTMEDELFQPRGSNIVLYYTVLMQELSFFHIFIFYLYCVFYLFLSYILAALVFYMWTVG